MLRPISPTLYSPPALPHIPCQTGSVRSERVIFSGHRNVSAPAGTCSLHSLRFTGKGVWDELLMQPFNFRVGQQCLLLDTVFWPGVFTDSLIKLDCPDHSDLHLKDTHNLPFPLRLVIHAKERNIKKYIFLFILFFFFRKTFVKT